MVNAPKSIKSYSRLATVGFFTQGLVVVLLVACGGKPTLTPQTTAVLLAVTTTPKPSDSIPTPYPNTPTSTLASTHTTSAIPTPTMEATQSTWLATAIAIATSERATSNLAHANEATKAAQFPVACDGDSFPSGDVSPDGKWLASSCGYKRDQLLVVQNKAGTKWTLEFKDFLSPESSEGMPGTLYPQFWSPDGEFLFFATALGYSGGGNDCFPGFGVYGLFRLSLATGAWTTFIPPTDSFPGYEIKFSPTGRRFAADLDGILIADLQIGEITQIDEPGVMDLSWAPDGVNLAYSVAKCGEEEVYSSSIYIWNALTTQIQILTATEGRKVLRLESWSDNSTLRVREEKFVNRDGFYTIYVYDIIHKNLVSMGTATPSP